VESARHALTKILEADPENEEALELMREIKSAAPFASGAAERRPAPAKAAPAKSFPVIPAAVAAGVILIGGGLFAFFGMGKKDTNAIDAPIVKKEGTTPAGTTDTPGANSKNPETPVKVVTAEQRDAAAKLVAEANFYMQEKLFPEALQKAEEALKLDPDNRDATGIKSEAARRIRDAMAAEKKLLTDANNYFEFSEFAGAVKLYEKYLEVHPEAVNEVQPQIIKCYYNLGVITLRQWKCDTAADYFRQVLFIDENDQMSKDALALARKCQQVGTSDVEMRKQVTFLEMRK
jgi:tetratricopeptide (TPR) repeat protein